MKASVRLQQASNITRFTVIEASTTAGANLTVSALILGKYVSILSSPFTYEDGGIQRMVTLNKGVLHQFEQKLE